MYLSHWVGIDEVTDDEGKHFSVAADRRCAERTLEKLADLIDRPTCKKLKNDQHRYWRCSHCGAFVRWDAATDSTGVRPVSYCPNCGAEVAK